MGSRFREPRPKSPERLRLRSIDSAKYDEDGYLTVQATFTYDTWCCSDSHEITDAIVTLQNVVEDSNERALVKRMKKANEEHLELLKEISESRDVQQ